MIRDFDIRRWLKEHGQTQLAFSAFAGPSLTQVSTWCSTAAPTWVKFAAANAEEWLSENPGRPLPALELPYLSNRDLRQFCEERDLDSKFLSDILNMKRITVSLWLADPEKAKRSLRPPFYLHHVMYYLSRHGHPPAINEPWIEHSTAVGGVRAPEARSARGGMIRKFVPA